MILSFLVLQPVCNKNHIFGLYCICKGTIIPVIFVAERGQGKRSFSLSCSYRHYKTSAVYHTSSGQSVSFSVITRSLLAPHGQRVEEHENSRLQDKRG